MSWGRKSGGTETQATGAVGTGPRSAALRAETAEGRNSTASAPPRVGAGRGGPETATHLSRGVLVTAPRDSHAGPPAAGPLAAVAPLQVPLRTLDRAEPKPQPEVQYIRSLSQSFSSPLEIHLFLDAWMEYSSMEMTKEYPKSCTDLAMGGIDLAL